MIQFICEMWDAGTGKNGGKSSLFALEVDSAVPDSKLSRMARPSNRQLVLEALRSRQRQRTFFCVVLSSLPLPRRGQARPLQVPDGRTVPSLQSDFAEKCPFMFDLTLLLKISIKVRLIDNVENVQKQMKHRVNSPASHT